jgi:hypothetical protein
MQRRFGVLRTGLFTLACGAALAFGAATALEAAPIPACKSPVAAGSCSTDAGCTRLCQSQGASLGNCDEPSYCCYCIHIPPPI